MPRKYIKKNLNKNYSENDFKLAIEFVHSGSSIREAANRYAVPYTTLNSHVNSNVLYDHVGRPTKFTKEEEGYIEQAALVLQSWGVPLSIDEFLNLSKNYASSLNKSHLFPSETPTYDWLCSFLKRHDNLTLKKSYPLEKKRAALTLEQVDEWFQLLDKIIQDNDLANHPAQIFNCDESGLSDTISCSKVIVHRQTQNPYRLQGGSGGKSYISVMFCASATGFLLPPFVIYKSKRLFQEWCVGGPPHTGFDNSDSGWMDQSLFYRWFEQIFLEQTKNLPRPLLLIIDGHGSHFDVETLKLAIQNDVIILCLPSNATHVIQPLDIVFFNTLKIEWKKILKAEYTRTNYKVVGKARFPSLLMQLWSVDALQIKTNIVKSFMKAGVFPFNPKSINRSRILKNNASVGSRSSISVTYSTNTSNNNQTINTSNNNQTINTLNNNQTINTSNNNQTTNPSSSNNLGTLNDNSHALNNYPPMTNVVSSSRPIVSSFTSSHEAIGALDQLIEETKSNDSSHVEDDDDEEYFPSKSSFASSITTSSTKKQKSQPTNSLAMKRHQSTSTQQNKKRKILASKIIGFDSSDEDDDVIIDLPPAESQRSLQEIQKSQPTTSLVMKHQPMPSQQKKRKKIASKTVSFDTSDEDDDIVLNSPPAESQKALAAIANAIQAVFGGKSKEISEKPAKRTVLNRTNGQIITEKHVIEQLEERKNKQSSKRSRSISQNSNGTKRRKKEKNDQSIISGRISTGVQSSSPSMIPIQSSSSSMIPIQSSISINTSSSNIQHTLQPTSYLSSFSKNTRGSVQIDPDDSSESSDYLAHIYQPLQD